MHVENHSFAGRGGWWVMGQALLMSLVVAGGWWGGGAWQLSAATAAGWVLLGVGAVVGWLGFARLGRATTPFPRPLPDARLVTTGIYGLVRHPLYASVLLASFGWSLVRSSGVALAVSLLLFAFFDAKARREERWLGERFPEYAGYARRVRRLLPWVYGALFGLIFRAGHPM